MRKVMSGQSLRGPMSSARLALDLLFSEFNDAEAAHHSFAGTVRK